MYRISSIEIVGFRGANTKLVIPLDKEVNFFIGRNGAGKTRLMTLLNSALSAEISSLLQIDFSSVVFKLKREKDRAKPYIKVTKSADKDGDFSIEYEIASSVRGEKKNFSFGNVDLHGRWMRRQTSLFNSRLIFPEHAPEPVSKAKEAIENLVGLSWISVHRAALDAIQEGEKRFASPVDRKVYQVARDFGVYFSILDKRAAEETDKFQQIYLLSLISPSGFHALSSMESVNPDEEKQSIRGMFAEFNIKSSAYSSKLESFSRRMTRALENYKPNQAIEADDFLVLTDTIRIHDAVKEWHKLLEKRSEIYEPKDDFVKIINGMLYKKRVDITAGNQPNFLDDNGSDLDIDSLSSGEKQLFILLGETLLQRRRPCVFMADEPELSLHIDWQERLVPSLRRINPNAQIIFATHSPDIVGAYDDNTIDLELI